MCNVRCCLQHTGYLSKINFALGKQGLHFAFFFAPPCLLYVPRYWLVPLDIHFLTLVKAEKTHSNSPSNPTCGSDICRCTLAFQCIIQCLLCLHFSFISVQNNSLATSLHSSVFTWRIYMKGKWEVANRIQLGLPQYRNNLSFSIDISFWTLLFACRAQCTHKSNYTVTISGIIYPKSARISP